VTRSLRLLKILFTIWRYGLVGIVAKSLRPGLLRFLLQLYAFLGPRSASRGQSLRLALEALGPIFVKFGQVLSTRRDLLPLDIADELAKLQDQVPPFSEDQSVRLIEASLGQSIDEVFSHFERKPVASASVAQVHFGVLKAHPKYPEWEGRAVAIKVLRPGILPIIESDLALLKTIAGLVEKFWKDGKRLKPKENVEEFDTYLHDELDLMREAANASQLRRNFADSDKLMIPEIYWDLSGMNVMVMERMYGIPISRLDDLVKAGIDLKKLASDGVEIFFTQVFEHGFFHADMHPGNIFVQLPDKYLAVDFGIVGSLSDSDQRYLAENFLAFFNHDYRRVAQMHIESGWVPSTTRIEEFEAAIRSVCEPIFDKPLKDISFGLLLLRLFQTARRFDMVVQPQLVLLQKTLLNIEGLGRQLYPELDLWQTAKPFLEDWFKQRMGPAAKVKELFGKFPEITEQLPEIPTLVFQALQSNAMMQHQMQQHNQEMAQLRRQLQSNNNRTFWTIITSSLLIGAAVLLPSIFN